MMKLAYSPANAAWVFMFGRTFNLLTPINLRDYGMWFRDRREALKAARVCGLRVTRCGTVLPRKEKTP